MVVTGAAIRLAGIAVGLVAASGANAQLNVDALVRPKVQSAGCTEIVWRKELLAYYPRIGDACQEVIVSNGEKFARFTGTLVRMSRDRYVTVDFKDRRGRSLGQFILQPARTQRVQIEGQTYRMSDLKPGQELNLYAPESRYAIATKQGRLPEAMGWVLDKVPTVDQAAPVARPQASAEAAVALGILAAAAMQSRSSRTTDGCGAIVVPADSTLRWHISCGR